MNTVVARPDNQMSTKIMTTLRMATKFGEDVATPSLAASLFTGNFLNVYWGQAIMLELIKIIADNLTWF